MSHCCSQCSFSAQFESALRMHHQLHHEPSTLGSYPEDTPKQFTEKSNTVPRTTTLDSSLSSNKESKGFRYSNPSGRLSTHTFFHQHNVINKFRRIRSCLRGLKIQFEQEFENVRHVYQNMEEDKDRQDLSIASECSPRVLNSSVSRSSAVTTSLAETRETYGCHICNFDADRITVLDRHLLNDHKIGLDNLLKLVLAKTRDGLSEECPNPSLYGIRQPYYRLSDEILEEGEFVIETVMPKIKILKHSATNTEIQWTDIPDLKDNCRMITKELEKLMKYPAEKCDKNELLSKMQTLSECMCKFVDSTNTIKKVLTKEFDSKTSVRERLSTVEPFFDLGLGDQESPREWEKAHSEKTERSRNRGSKPKYSSESFYF